MRILDYDPVMLMRPNWHYRIHYALDKDAPRSYYHGMMAYWEVKPDQELFIGVYHSKNSETERLAHGTIHVPSDFEQKTVVTWSENEQVGAIPVQYVLPNLDSSDSLRKSWHRLFENFPVQDGGNHFMQLALYWHFTNTEPVTLHDVMKKANFNQVRI